MKINYECNEEYIGDEEILGFLLLEGHIIINNGWWKTDWPKDSITVAVICNDIFAWGCADAEDILYSDLEEIYEFYKKDPDWGIAAWCIKKRKQMPQKPVADLMKKSGIWNLDELVHIDI